MLDEHRLVIADLGGNNRLDTLQNIVDTGRIGLIFVVPGQSETVRVNGAACITVDPELLAGFDLPRLPKAAIGVTVESTYIHCAKAFRRGGMWDPNVWAELAGSPDGADIIACQFDSEFDAAVVRDDLRKGYDLALRWEAGEEDRTPRSVARRRVPPGLGPSAGVWFVRPLYGLVSISSRRISPARTPRFHSWCSASSRGTRASPRRRTAPATCRCPRGCCGRPG